MTPWRVCPDCGWNYDLHGDTHRWRFKCDRALPEHMGGQYPPTETRYTGTATEAEADAQTAAVVLIMETHRVPFHEAMDIYIRQRAA